MMCLFPFLNTGVTLAEVHSAGSFPPLVERLNSSNNGLERLEAPSFRSRPGTPSGPHALETSILLKSLYTWSGATEKFSISVVLLVIWSSWF